MPRLGGEGYLLGQAASYGITQQSTIVPGVTPGAAVPAAGAEYTFVCQPYDRWRLVACRFELTTDSNAANRFVTIDYLDGQGVPIVSDGAAVATPATITARPYSGALTFSGGTGITGSALFFPLSGLFLEPGQRVKIAVANIQVGDQLGRIRLTFDRWPENPSDYGDEHWQARELRDVQPDA